MALKECHRHKDSTGKVTPILHRDLKPGNIFMDSAQNIKIGDFGLAKELGSESKFATTNVGTPFYMSPEMINEQKYNEKSDIWALGCLLYELCALVPPFDAHNHLSLAVKINAGKFDRIPSVYSEDLHRAIRWMLSLEVCRIFNRSSFDPGLSASNLSTSSSTCNCIMLAVVQASCY